MKKSERDQQLQQLVNEHNNLVINFHSQSGRLQGKIEMLSQMEVEPDEEAPSLGQTDSVA